MGEILDKMLANATKRRYERADEVIKDLYAPTHTPTPGFKPVKVLVASGILVFALLGVRSLVTPVRRQVSTPYSPKVNTQPQRGATPPGGGGLFTTVEGEWQVFPLQHTAVAAKIAGNISRVEVTQTFANPYNKPLEAVYKFPLPDEAAVDDMEIRIGDRLIKGMIEKRDTARQIYEEAKQEGRTAGLLEQERANIFTQSLANILPGEQIHVTIRYTNSLKFEGGDYEFVFPMVVAPRYMGDTSEQSDSAQLNPPLLPADRPGQDIEVGVEIDAGVPVSMVHSPTHEVAVTQASFTVRVQLANKNTIPNKDLILRYRVASAATQATVLTQGNDQGGHFATYLIPAIEYDSSEIVPKDVVFLVDTSGSQAGAAIEQSKELMRQFINGLNPQDTFTIMDFASTAKKLSEQPLANTPANREKAMDYVNSLQANGGTELMNGINTVLNFPPAPEGRLRSLVLLTNGLIGNDQQVLGAVQKRLQRGNRVYTFGVGSSTNHFLINRLAEIGRGTAEVLPPSEPAQKVATEFFQEINNPVLTNVEISWLGNGTEPEIYPLAAPDLFANQPLVLYGKKEDGMGGKLRITGTVAGGKGYEKILPVNFNQVSGQSPVAQLWGRARIKDLMNQIHFGETPDLVKAVTDTALTYRLLSEYTAFVAVTEEVRTNGQQNSFREEVAVELPEGMSRDVAQPTAQTPQKASSQVHTASKSTSSQKSSKDVPEPGQIWGNFLALLSLILFFFWKGSRNKKR